MTQVVGCEAQNTDTMYMRKHVLSEEARTSMKCVNWCKRNFGHGSAAKSKRVPNNSVKIISKLVILKWSLQCRVTGLPNKFGQDYK